MEKKNHKKLTVNTKTLYRFTSKNGINTNGRPDTTLLTATTSAMMAKGN